MAEQSTGAGGEGAGLSAAATDTVRQAAGQARDQATRVVDQIREQAEGFANEKKAAAADQISGLASALRKTAEELQQSELGFGEYVERAASGLEEFSESIRERDFGSLLGDVESLARQYPAAFLGATVVAGFMFTRFLKSSGQSLTGNYGGDQADAQGGAGQRRRGPAGGGGGGRSQGGGQGARAGGGSAGARGGAA